MVSLYYISIHLLKINGVFSTRTSLNFIRNLALLSLLFSKTKNSFNTKISILLVYIPIRLNAFFFSCNQEAVVINKYNYKQLFLIVFIISSPLIGSSFENPI